VGFILAPVFETLEVPDSAELLAVAITCVFGEIPHCARGVDQEGTEVSQIRRAVSHFEDGGMAGKAYWRLWGMRPMFWKPYPIPAHIPYGTAMIQGGLLRSFVVAQCLVVKRKKCDEERSIEIPPRYLSPSHHILGHPEHRIRKLAGT
jgi:hypothetical protein